MTTLADRWREAREAKRLTMNKLDQAIGKAQFTTRIESGDKSDPALETVAAAAAVLGVRPAWLAWGIGPREGSEEAERVAELPAVTFVSQLPRLQKLISTICQHPKRDWKVWHLVAVVQDFLEHPSLATADGDPTRGTWADVLDEKAGLMPPPKVVGGIERARRSHWKEHRGKRSP